MVKQVRVEKEKVRDGGISHMAKIVREENIREERRQDRGGYKPSY